MKTVALKRVLVLCMALALSFLLFMSTAAAISIPLPKIELPPIELPPIELPQIELPTPALPEVVIPDIELPTPALPEVVIPDLPTPGLGTVQTPSAATDELAAQNHWPQNGEVFRDADHAGQGIQFNVTIAQSDAGTASYLKIYRDGTLVSGLFIRETGTATTSLGAGTYTVKMGVGEEWLGQDKAFGSAGQYQTMLFNGGAETVALEANGVYTLTVNTSRSDPDAKDVGTKTESYQDF